MKEITRRDFVKTASTSLAIGGLSNALFANSSAAQLSKMGIASTSFSGAYVAVPPTPGAPPGAPTVRPAGRDAVEF